MLLDLLLSINILICLALIGVVLLQRSEGGAFGGGSPTGLITARGAGDLLTRTTWVLFSLFLVISLALTLLGAHERSDQATLNALKNLRVNPNSLPTLGGKPAAPPAGGAPTQQGPAGAVLPPLAPTQAPAQSSQTAPATSPGAASGLALPPLGGAPRPAKP
jgi:preprotein translocase subunit SecG